MRSSAAIDQLASTTKQTALRVLRTRTFWRKSLRSNITGRDGFPSAMAAARRPGCMGAAYRKVASRAKSVTRRATRLVTYRPCLRVVRVRLRRPGELRSWRSRWPSRRFGLNISWALKAFSPPPCSLFDCDPWSVAPALAVAPAPPSLSS